MKIKLNSPRGPFVVVDVISNFMEIFSLPQIPKTIQMLTGKLQQNATLLAKQALNALNSNIECVNAFSLTFANPQQGVYNLHSLVCSVGELSGEQL